MPTYTLNDPPPWIPSRPLLDESVIARGFELIERGLPPHRLEAALARALGRPRLLIAAEAEHVRSCYALWRRGRRAAKREGAA